MRSYLASPGQGAAASGSAAQPAQPKLNSIADVVRWLKSVSDAMSDPELTKVHAAAEVLQEEAPTKKQLRLLCKPWNQPLRRDQACLTVPVLTAEWRERERERERVVAASNQVRLRLARMQNTSGV